MGKIITVTSEKSGAGKTTIASAISSSLAILGYKTLCLSFGKGAKSLGSALCLDDSRSIDNSAGQDRAIEDCLEHTKISNLFLHPTSSPFTPDKLNSSVIETIFSEIRNKYDYCIIDTPPISYPRFRLVHADADMTIIVTTAKPPTMIDVRRAVKAANVAGSSDIRLLVNRINPNKTLQMFSAASNIADMVGTKLMGVIPYCEIVSESLCSETPLVFYESNRIVSNFKNIAFSISSEVKCFTESLPITDEEPGVVEEKTVPVYDTSKFLGSYGNPMLWAKSTLKKAKLEDLVEVYKVVPGQYVTDETVRNRIWIHDLLDDYKIPYYIEVRCMSGSRNLVEAQRIFVELEYVGNVLNLIKEFSSTNNIVRENINNGAY